MTQNEARTDNEWEPFIRDPMGVGNYPADAQDLPAVIQLSIADFANIVGLAGALEALMCDPPSAVQRDPDFEREKFTQLNRMLIAAATANRVGEHAEGWSECGARTALFSAAGFVDVDSAEGRQILADMEMAGAGEGDA